MIIGTVADIREDMLFFSERRDADPGHAFRAHVGKGCGVPFHPLCHKVAADAESARLPSGTFVELLCGQPEQKYGVRSNVSLLLRSISRGIAET